MNPHPELVDAFRKAFVFICQNHPMGPTNDRTPAGKLIDELRIPLANATPDFSEQDRNEWANASLFYVHANLEALSYGMPEGTTERGCLREAMRKIELADTYVEKRLREEAA
jgi:hypothetical protein